MSAGIQLSSSLPVNREPSQSVFENLSHEALPGVVGMLSHSDSGLNATSILEKIGHLRHTIARRMDDPHALDFGLQRYDASRPPSVTYRTFLCSTSGGSIQAGYGEASKELCAHYLMPHVGVNNLLKNGDSSIAVIPFLSSELGVRNSIEISFIPLDQLVSLSERVVGKLGQTPFMKPGFEELRNLKLTEPATYQEYRTLLGANYCVAHTDKFFAEAIRENPVFLGFAKMTFRVELEPNRAYGLSNYFAAVRTSQDRSIPTVFPFIILHSDSLMVLEGLKKINDLVRGILTDKMGIGAPNILKKIGYVRYLMAHTCMFQRGSAWTAEIFETALFRFLGERNYPLKLNSEVDLWALSSDLPRFLERFAQHSERMIAASHSDVISRGSPKQAVEEDDTP